MGTVGSGEVVKLFPLGKFGVQIDITRVAEKLVELLLIRSVGSFDFAVKLRRAGLDVGVTDAFVFDMCRVDVNSESQQSCKIKAWPLTLIVPV